MGARGVRAAAFGVGAAYCPGILSGGFMPRWWVMALLPLAADVSYRNLPPAVLASLLAGLAWAAASLAVTPDPASASLDLIFMALLINSAVAAAGLDDPGAAVDALAWGVATSSPLAIAQLLGWHPVSQLSPAPSGTFMSSEVFAEAAAPLLAWAALRASRARPASIALAAALAVPLAVCGSRVALLAAAAGLLAGWRAPNRWAKPAIGTVAICLALAAIPLLGPAKLQSGLDRMVLWGAAAQSITFAGRGLGWWAATHPAGAGEFAHSDALQMVVELGAGSLPFLAAAMMIPMGRATGAAERSALAALAVEFLVSFPLHLPATGLLAALLAGGLAGRRAGLRGVGPPGRARPRADDGRREARRRRMDQGGEPGDRDLPDRPALAGRRAGDSRPGVEGGLT